jgi:pilus assembly protein FimV
LADSHLEKYFEKLMGNRDLEDSLERFDMLTQEEARMASAELPKMTHSVDGKVTGVDDRVKSVEGKVQGVHGDVQEVGNMVQSVEGRVRSDVQDTSNMVQDVDDRVQGVDDKLDQANRSLSLNPWSSF